MLPTRPRIIIEHLEDHASRWLLLEYEHAAKIAGEENLIVTNTRRCHDLISEVVPRADKRSVRKIFRADELIILDPDADKILEPEDLREGGILVVGGILGDHPRRGRTRTLLTAKIPGATARSLGPHQFSIDGAVYIGLEVAKGRRLSEIPVVVGLSLKLPEEGELELPYAYPLVNGRPLIYNKLVEYLLGEYDVERSRIIAEALKEAGDARL